MAEQVEHKGQCLCGAVKIRVTAPMHDIDACHCPSCRKTTGGGPFFGIGVPKSAVHIEGAEHIGIYCSTDHAERGFCKCCGSNLFFRMAGVGTSENISLCPGVFEDQAGFEIVSEMFIDTKPDFYALEGDRPRITRAEAHAQLAAFLEARRKTSEDSS